MTPGTDSQDKEPRLASDIQRPTSKVNARSARSARSQAHHKITPSILEGTKDSVAFSDSEQRRAFCITSTSSRHSATVNQLFETLCKGRWFSTHFVAHFNILWPRCHYGIDATVSTSDISTLLHIKTKTNCRISVALACLPKGQAALCQLDSRRDGSSTAEQVEQGYPGLHFQGAYILGLRAPTYLPFFDCMSFRESLSFPYH